MTQLLSANPYISSSGIVTVYLLLIVFSVLAFLVLVLWCGEKGKAWLAKRKQRRAQTKQSIKAGELPDAAQSALSQADEEEEIAAVMAAVYVVLQADTPQKRAKFVVKRIERI